MPLMACIIELWAELTKHLVSIYKEKASLRRYYPDTGSMGIISAIRSLTHSFVVLESFSTPAVKISSRHQYNLHHHNNMLATV